MVWLALLIACFEDPEPVASDPCTDCHGSPETGSAPPAALGGFTDPSNLGVGSHEAHVNGTRLQSPVACSECHLWPDSVDAEGHIDTPWPAEVGWGELGKTGALSQPWDREAATCTVYCHGSTLGGGTMTAPGVDLDGRERDPVRCLPRQPAASAALAGRRLYAVPRPDDAGHAHQRQGRVLDAQPHQRWRDQHGCRYGCRDRNGDRHGHGHHRYRNDHHGHRPHRRGQLQHAGLLAVPRDGHQRGPAAGQHGRDRHQPAKRGGSRDPPGRNRDVCAGRVLGLPHRDPWCVRGRPHRSCACRSRAPGSGRCRRSHHPGLRRRRPDLHDLVPRQLGVRRNQSRARLDLGRNRGSGVRFVPRVAAAIAASGRRQLLELPSRRVAHHPRERRGRLLMLALVLGLALAQDDLVPGTVNADPETLHAIGVQWLVSGGRRPRRDRGASVPRSRGRDLERGAAPDAGRAVDRVRVDRGRPVRRECARSASGNLVGSGAARRRPRWAGPDRGGHRRYPSRTLRSRESQRRPGDRCERALGVP